MRSAFLLLAALLSLPACGAVVVVDEASGAIIELPDGCGVVPDGTGGETCSAGALVRCDWPDQAPLPTCLTVDDWDHVYDGFWCCK